jgi:TPR repeat protein
MSIRFAIAAALCAGLASPLAAAPVGDTVEDGFGVLNPEELTVQYWAARAGEGRFDPGMCMYGYPIAKMGWHEPARKIFERCAEHGNPHAMPWAAWTEENGYDKPANPAAAAEWDRKLAETGSPLGQLNYGLDVLRGHGVARDRALGKALVDKAAAAGEPTAKALAAADYNPEAVTPTADLAHYRQPQF